MKKTLLVIVLFLTLGQVTGQNTSKQVLVNFNKLKWLEGTWNRTNNKPGKSGTERWVKTSSQELRGWGVAMKGSDTVFVEKLRILIKEDNVFYIADVPENEKLVYFKLTEISDSDFVCENPDHDFPKKIAYHLDGNKLKATVSGDGKSIEYLFERK